MAMTLLEAKNWLKSNRGLTRDSEDGLIDDTILQEAIHDAIKRTAKDCDLLPTREKLPLVAGQWEYPIPETLSVLRAIYREDNNGRKLPLTQITQEQFESYHDAEDETTADPEYFAYPIYRGRRFQFYVKAPDNYDFLPTSRVTGQSIRTVRDSGANFGRTLSGERISPGDVVHNHTADSYGYVEILDMITARTTKTCTSGTTSSIIQSGSTDWDALGVKVDDLITHPASGIPQTYAFVSEIDGVDLHYTDVRGVNTEFSSGNGIKVGVANKIRLSTGAPHRGLRSGSYNYFKVDTVTATITGTTFTPTRCTGSSASGASAGEEAIASGGSHGYITAVGSNYIDVTCWIGGVPGPGETVTTRPCDEYSVQTRPMIQPEIWLRPTPSTSDSVGTERLWISFDIQPFLPTEDYEYLDIPEKFLDAYKACLEWTVSMQTGTHKPKAVAEYKQLYVDELLTFQGDIHEVARGQIMTPWGNRYPTNSRQGNMGTNSGNIYDVNSMVSDQNG